MIILLARRFHRLFRFGRIVCTTRLSRVAVDTEQVPGVYDVLVWLVLVMFMGEHTALPKRNGGGSGMVKT